MPAVLHDVKDPSRGQQVRHRVREDGPRVLDGDVAKEVHCHHCIVWLRGRKRSGVRVVQRQVCGILGECRPGVAEEERRQVDSRYVAVGVPIPKCAKQCSRAAAQLQDVPRPEPCHLLCHTVANPSWRWEVVQRPHQLLVKRARPARKVAAREEVSMAHVPRGVVDRCGATAERLTEGTHAL